MTLTDGRLREGDRMLLSARFLEGEVTAEVRIVRVHSRGPDLYAAGGSFISMPGVAQAVLGRVLGRLGGNARPPADMAALRESLAEAEPANPLKPEQSRADDAYWTFAKRSAAHFPVARRAV
jgi:hypothetical protein